MMPFLLAVLGGVRRWALGLGAVDVTVGGAKGRRFTFRGRRGRHA